PTVRPLFVLREGRPLLRVPPLSTLTRPSPSPRGAPSPPPERGFPAGLLEPRRREWLLDIAYRKRETFAYACEFHSCVLEHSSDAGSRRRLAAEAIRAKSLADDRVDPAEVADIVLEAAGSRAGWKVIRRRCSSAVGTWPQRTTQVLSQRR